MWDAVITASEVTVEQIDPLRSRPVTPVTQYMFVYATLDPRESKWNSI